MNTSRLVYRSRQFWQALTTRPSEVDKELVASILDPGQVELFNLLQKSEQTHSIRVLKAVRKQGGDNIDLQAAAMLHDIGKVKEPLRLWERILIVITNAICPACVKEWGAAQGEVPSAMPGWQRAFVVAEQHPAWGAELASQCGASVMTVALIARHQEKLSPEGAGEDSEENRLLRILQAADKNS